MTTTTPQIEVRDMRIIHRTFRNVYDESARLVRANPTPSPRRVAFLADHIDFGLSMLHHHHESEDLLLYPVLISRVPAQAAHTEDVEHEHLQVAGAIATAERACATWRAYPTPDTGEALASSLTELNDQLQSHLDDEERDIVPLAAANLTQQEWEAIGAHSRAEIPRDKMPIAFGMILEPLDDADRAFMKGHLPAPVRLLFPLLIQRPWDKYADTLRNGT